MRRDDRNPNDETELTRLRSENEALRAEVVRVTEEGRKDYDGMRDMQRKFIDADHKRIRLESDLAEAVKSADAERELIVAFLRDSAVSIRRKDWESNVPHNIENMADMIESLRHRVEAARLVAKHRGNEDANPMKCEECKGGVYESKPTPNWPTRLVCNWCSRIRVPESKSLTTP